MTGISFTITPITADNLNAIDALRVKILATPMPYLEERKLRWHATITHIIGSLSLSGMPVSHGQVMTYLLHPSKKPDQIEHAVLAYKNILDWFAESWTANPKPISFSLLEAFARVLLPERLVTPSLRADEHDIRHLLAYISTQSDHPVILAGVAHGLLAETAISETTHGMFTNLVRTLMFTKYGYDCRGWIALEPYCNEDKNRYYRALSSIERTGQQTAWIEYFTAMTKIAYESLESVISGKSVSPFTATPAALWQLNDRDQKLLRILESPTNRITNHDLQTLFHISQVTASRTLTRLTALGLLYTHGKGRSVYYTKAA